MNLDEVFGLSQEMPLVAMNPILLLSCIGVSILAGWFCVHCYRKTYEIEKSIKLFIPFALSGAVVFTLLGIPAMFAGGAQLGGFAVMLLISNHYFNKD